MAAVPNESGFILEVPLKRYCAKVKGEQFAARFGDPAQFVVLEVGRSRPLVGTVGQVAVGVFHRHQQEDGAVFVRTVRYYPSGRQDAFKSKVGFTLQKLQPVYRIDRTTGSSSGPTENTGVWAVVFLWACCSDRAHRQRV